MPWPKGKPRSEATTRAIARARIYGPAPHNICVCGKECPKPGATSCSVECSWSSTDRREKIRQKAKDPAWRKRVSEATKEKMHDPDIRARHLDALSRVFAEAPEGNNFRGMGQGGVSLLEMRYDWLLELGYINNYPVQVGSCRYRLDYALVDQKIDIEIDGASHRNRQESDALRTKVLNILGWKVIRVREW